MDVFVGMIGAMIAFAGAADKDLYLPNTRGWYLLIGRYCPEQNGQNDSEVQEDRRPGYFVEHGAFEDICHFFCPPLQTYVQFSMDDKKELAKLFRLEAVAIPAYSIFVGQRYLLHGGYGW